MKKGLGFEFWIALIAAIALVVMFYLISQHHRYLNQTIKEETSVYSIKVDYPSFTNSVINSQIEALVNQAVLDIKSYPPRPKDYPVEYKNELAVAYERPYVSKKYVSIYFEFMTYTGTAHPNTKIVTLNFEAKTGKRITLGDITATSEAKIIAIKQELRRQLLARLNYTSKEDLKWLDEGIKQNQLDTFTLDGKGINYYFQQYEVACYADGPQKVFIPRNKL